MHFCPNLPIILVGLKRDLRHDNKVIEELRRTNQSPVTTEEVWEPTTGVHYWQNRPNPLRRRLGLSNISNVPQRSMKVSEKSLNMRLVLQCLPRLTERRRSVSSCRLSMPHIDLHFGELNDCRMGIYSSSTGDVEKQGTVNDTRVDVFDFTLIIAVLFHGCFSAII